MYKHDQISFNSKEDRERTASSLHPSQRLSCPPQYLPTWAALARLLHLPFMAHLLHLASALSLLPAQAAIMSQKATAKLSRLCLNSHLYCTRHFLIISNLSSLDHVPWFLTPNSTDFLSYHPKCSFSVPVKDCLVSVPLLRLAFLRFYKFFFFDPFISHSTCSPRQILSALMAFIAF